MVARLASLQPPAHPSFRLWLTMAPIPGVPSALLGIGPLLVWEAPQGVRAILRDIFKVMAPGAFPPSSNATGAMAAWPELLLRLSLLHAVMLVSRH